MQVADTVVRIRVSGAAQVILFAKVYDVDQAGNATLPDQLAAPLQVTGAAARRDVTVRLPAIDDGYCPVLVEYVLLDPDGTRVRS